MTTNISKINEIFDYLENEENTDIKSIHLLIKDLKKIYKGNNKLYKYIIFKEIELNRKLTLPTKTFVINEDFINSFWFDNFKEYVNYVETGNSFLFNYNNDVLDENNDDEIKGGGNIQNYLLQSYAIDNGHDFNELLKDNQEYLFRLEDIQNIITNYPDINVNSIKNSGNGIVIKETNIFFEILKSETDITDNIYFLYLKNYLEKSTEYPDIDKKERITGKPFNLEELDTIKKDLNNFFDEFLGDKYKQFIVDYIPVLAGLAKDNDKYEENIYKMAKTMGYSSSSPLTFKNKYIELWENLKISFKDYISSRQFYTLEDIFDSANISLRGTYSSFQEYLNSLSTEEINFIAFITKLGFDKEFTLEGLDTSPELIEINKCFNKDIRHLFTVGYYKNLSNIYKSALIFKQTDFITSSTLFIKLISNPTNFIYEEETSPVNFYYAIDLEILKSHNIFSKGNISNIIINHLNSSSSLNEIITKLSISTDDKEKYELTILIYICKYFIKLKNIRQITGGFFQVPIVDINYQIDYNSIDNPFDTSLKINIGRALFDFKKAGDLSKVLFVYYFNFFINKFPSLNGTLGKANEYFNWNLIYTANDKLAVLNSIIRKQNNVIYADKGNYSFCVYKSNTEKCSFQFFLNLLTINLKLAKFNLVPNKKYDLFKDFKNFYKDENSILINYLFSNNNEIFLKDEKINKMNLGIGNDCFTNDILSKLFNSSNYPLLLQSTNEELLNFNQLQNEIKDGILEIIIKLEPSNIIRQTIQNNLKRIVNTSNLEELKKELKNLRREINYYNACNYLNSNPIEFQNYIKKLIIILLINIKKYNYEITKNLLGNKLELIDNLFGNLVQEFIDIIINDINTSFNFTTFKDINKKLNELNLFIELVFNFLNKTKNNLFKDIYKIPSVINEIIVNLNLFLTNKFDYDKLLKLLNSINSYEFYLNIIKNNFKNLDNVSNFFKSPILSNLIDKIKILYLYYIKTELNKINYEEILQEYLLKLTDFYKSKIIISIPELKQLNEDKNYKNKKVLIDKLSTLRNFLNIDYNNIKKIPNIITELESLNKDETNISAKFTDIGKYLDSLSFTQPISSKNQPFKKAKIDQSNKTMAKKDLIKNYNKILIIEKKLKELDENELNLKKSVEIFLNLPIKLNLKINNLFMKFDIDLKKINKPNFIYKILGIKLEASSKGGSKLLIS